MLKKPLMVHLCYFILMQYKFFVDGEWRHDEHQPFVSGNGGVVNTIFITGPDMVPAGFSPETLGRSNMDVDDVFLRTVRNLTFPFPKCSVYSRCLMVQVSRVASSLVSLILIRGWYPSDYF